MPYIKYLIALPFICFLLGYLSIHYLIGTHSFATPTLVGLSVLDACEITTAHTLALKIIGHTRTNQVCPGTIVHQTPGPESRIKSYQSIYVVVAQEPECAKTPNLIGMHETHIKTSALAQTHPITYYEVPSAQLRGICIAQIPRAHEPLTTNRIIAYISQQRPKPVIWPDFTGMSVDEVQQLLHKYQLTASCIHAYPQHTGHICTQCRVTHQHPKPGSLIICDPHKPVPVQLYVT